MPFDFERRRVSVLIDDGSTRLLVVKGAPEDIIDAVASTMRQRAGERLPLDDAERQSLLQRFEAARRRGLSRARAWPRGRWPRYHDDAPSSATRPSSPLPASPLFVDPPKADAAAAIQALAAIGVEVKILTGDNERITRHICARSASR